MNNSTVDGADNNQFFFSEERGRTRISYVISQSSVREFQVNTSNFSSEYGRAAGAVINAVTTAALTICTGNFSITCETMPRRREQCVHGDPVRLSELNWTTEHIKPLDRRSNLEAHWRSYRERQALLLRRRRCAAPQLSGGCRRRQ